MSLGVAKALRARAEKLDWALAKVLELAVQSFDLKSAQVFNVLRQEALVSVCLEQVGRHLGFLALLQVAEDQINPLGQSHTDRVGLKGHAHLEDEVLGTVGPVRQDHVPNWLPHVVKSEVCVGLVEKE